MKSIILLILILVLLTSQAVGTKKKLATIKMELYELAMSAVVAGAVAAAAYYALGALKDENQEVAFGYDLGVFAG